MIYYHGTKLAQDTGHIQFINSINYNQYDKFISCNNIANHILQKGIRTLCGKSKASIQMKSHLLYLDLITKEVGTMLLLNGR